MVDLPRERAFLLQLSAGSDAAARDAEGWIEHLQSGEALHFHGRDEVFAFVARILQAADAGGPGEGA